MLRDSELTRIQALHDSWLNQVCSITRPDGGKTTDGWMDATPTSVYTDLECRAEPSTGNGRERRVSDAAQSNDDWLVHLPSGTIVKPMDTITVTDVGVFEVQRATTYRGVDTNVTAVCVKVEAV